MAFPTAANEACQISRHLSPVLQLQLIPVSAHHLEYGAACRRGLPRVAKGACVSALQVVRGPQLARHLLAMRSLQSQLQSLQQVVFLS